MQEGSGTEFVDEDKNFNSVVDISRDMVGITQPNSVGEYENRLYAAKAGINGAWYNWFGRFGGTGNMPGFNSITEVYPRLKLIRVISNWDNFNKVLLSDRSWDGSVYRSQKDGRLQSYVDENLMYSRQPKNGKIFVVFNNHSGALTLNSGETVTSISKVDDYFIESVDATGDFKISGGQIELKEGIDIPQASYSYRNRINGVWTDLTGTTSIGLGYIVTTSTASAPAVTTNKAVVSVSAASLEATVNPNGSQTVYWFEYGTDKSTIITNKINELSLSVIQGSTAVSNELKGLKSSTTYYYRIGARNEGGTSYGEILSFSTLSKEFGSEAYYAFDEDSGFTAVDSSGSGNNGAIKGASRISAGKLGRALFFDGSNDYVNFDSSLGLTGELTVSAWVYPEAAPSGVGRIIASTYDYDSTPANIRGWTLGNDYGSTNYIYFRIYDSSGKWAMAATSTSANQFFSANLNKWVHVAGVYKPSSHLKLYINGQMVAQDTTDVPLAIAYKDGTNLRIGMRADTTSSGMWNGDMDEVRIYSKALTDTEILALHNGQTDTTPPTISITSPTAEDTYATTSSTLSLSGSASDETAGSGLKEVTWSSSQGGSGTASLSDSSWSVSGITLQEGSNTITVTATDNSNNSSTDTLTVTYTPAQTGTIAFSQAAYSRSEGYTSATITVTRTGGSDGAASIQYSTSDGTATAGSDYTSSSSTLNWADGVLANKTLTVPIISDTIDEENETVNLTLTNATGATLGIISSTVLTINDNDNPPTVALTSTSQSKAENQGTATITLQLSSASGLEITVPFTLSGTAQTDGSDYSITPSPLTIPIGSTSTDITVTLTNDTTYETPDETLIITLGTPTNATRGSPSSHTLTITDDDAIPDTTPPTVSILSPTSSATYSTSSSALSLSGSATDNISLSSVTWTNDQGGSGTATLTGNTWTISNITLTQGDNLITVTATDSNTNTSTDTLTVTYTPITDTTLKASYSFDQSSGSTLTDSSGNNYNGTITGATWTSGKVGSGALSFNGTSDYVAIPRMNYDEITISAWFYKNADDLTSADAIFGGWRWNSSVSLQEGLDLRFPINSPDTISIVMVTTDGTAKLSKSSYYNFGSGKANNAWHHVAVTYNKADGNQRLYVGGVLRDTDLHAAGNTIVPLAAYTDMRIGYSRVNNGYFSGYIDDLRVYNYAITASEVTELYNYTGQDLTAITGAAANITKSTAILNATVNPNSQSTAVYFEYGLTASLGSVTSSQTITGSTDQAVTVDISGLSSNTTYYYRVAAQSSKGTPMAQPRPLLLRMERITPRRIYQLKYQRHLQPTLLKAKNHNFRRGLRCSKRC